MTARRTASTCIWATPTLLLDAPFWLEAEDAPWTCHRVSPPRPLSDTRGCAECAHWKSAGDVVDDPNWADGEPHPFLTDIIGRRF